MKKAIPGILIALIVLLACTYIWILSMFDGPIIADISDQVKYDSVLKEIYLPWYLNLGSEEFARWDGKDADEKAYTWFSYDLSALWEYAEMNCIVSWSDESAKLYVGESRAMFYIDEDFAHVDWRQ